MEETHPVVTEDGARIMVTGIPVPPRPGFGGGRGGPGWNVGRGPFGYDMLRRRLTQRQLARLTDDLLESEDEDRAHIHRVLTRLNDWCYIYGNNGTPEGLENQVRRYLNRTFARDFFPVPRATYAVFKCVLALGGRLRNGALLHAATIFFNGCVEVLALDFRGRTMMEWVSRIVTHPLIPHREKVHCLISLMRAGRLNRVVNTIEGLPQGFRGRYDIVQVARDALIAMGDAQNLGGYGPLYDDPRLNDIDMPYDGYGPRGGGRYGGLYGDLYADDLYDLEQNHMLPNMFRELQQDVRENNGHLRDIKDFLGVRRGGRAGDRRGIDWRNNDADLLRP